MSRCTPTCGRRSPCAASPRASAPAGDVTKVTYRLRKPVYAPADLAYTARVTAADGDTMTLELIEQHPSGEVGFEGTAWVSRHTGGEHHDISTRTRDTSRPHRELLGLLRGPRFGDGRHGESRRHRRPHRRLPRRGHDADPRQGARQRQHQGLCGHVPAAPRHGARAPRRERDPARRQRRRAQPRRAGRRNPRIDRTPRLRPAGLPHRRRRRLRSPRRSAAGRPLAAASDERRATVVLAASAADGQRLPGRVRHRAGAGQRRRHRHHRPGRRRLAGRRSRRLVVELDRRRTTTRSPARSPPDTSSNAGHRRPAATSPVSAPSPTSCSRGSRSPKSTPTVPQ